MRRMLAVATLIMVTLGTILVPGTVSAQSGDPCAAAAIGTYPDGYNVITDGTGGAGSQIVLGTESNDVLDGGSGHDILCGFGGDDVLHGGSGNDALYGGDGTDEIHAGSGNDMLVGTIDEVLDQGSGNDNVVIEDTTVDPCKGVSGICVPAGATVTLDSILRGCNQLVFRYFTNTGIGEQVLALPSDPGCPVGSTNAVSSNTTIGPFDQTVVLTLYLDDHSCEYTYESNSSHALVQEIAGGYQVDIADAGPHPICQHKDTSRQPVSGTGDLSVTMTINNP